MRTWPLTVASKGLTSVPGIKVGHFTDRREATGCTVVLCESGVVGGIPAITEIATGET